MSNTIGVDSVLYHYAFGPVKVVKEDNDYIEVEILSRDGLSETLKSLKIDLPTRVFHKKAIGNILFMDEEKVKNFIRCVANSVVKLDFSQRISQIPKALLVCQELIFKSYKECLKTVKQF